MREDQTLRRTAIRELETAAGELGRLMATLESGSAPEIDVRKFKGLLRWPAGGRATAA